MTEPIPDRVDARTPRIEPTTRRFTLFDAMVLIAATAFGLSVTRAYMGPWFDLSVFEYRIARATMAIEATVPPTLAALTLAVLALRLRRPRPRLRRVFRQPGAVAAVAALAGIMLGVLGVLNVGVFWGWDRAGLPIYLGRDAAWLGVASAWLTLAVTRRWGSDRSWPDRAGRALGACWIALMLLSIFTVPWKLGQPFPPILTNETTPDDPFAPPSQEARRPPSP